MSNIFEKIMKDIDMGTEGEEEKNETPEELEDSTEAAKIAKCEIARVVIKHLRTLHDEDERVDVCNGMINILTKLEMFADLGIEEVFQKQLDRLGEAIESLRKGE